MPDIKLRALEPEDIGFLDEIENDWDLWYLGQTQQPFSSRVLRNYIINADRDIYEAKQFRFAIEIVENQKLIGFVDLYDFDPKNRRAGVGIIIHDRYRGRSYGKETLKQLVRYAFEVLYLHQLYAEIMADNPASIRLFESLGFEKTGTLKQWYFNGLDYKDGLFYQLIRKYGN